jgi:hypothetical protein
VVATASAAAVHPAPLHEPVARDVLAAASARPVVAESLVTTAAQSGPPQTAYPDDRLIVTGSGPCGCAGSSACCSSCCAWSCCAWSCVFHCSVCAPVGGAVGAIGRIAASAWSARGSTR